MKLSMPAGRGLALCALLGTPSIGLGGPAIPPIPSRPLHAQLPLGTSFGKRCPDLQISETNQPAVVVFWLPRSGIPAQIAVKTASGSDMLDAAATACVAKLQFPPSTSLGDGQAVDSWQQIALTWAASGDTGDARPAAPAAAPPRTRDDAASPGGSVIVRACVDDTGALTHEPTIVRSSGQASLDQAAIRIAAAGAAYYQPDHAAGAAAATGCAQLTIKFDAK